MCFYFFVLFARLTPKQLQLFTPTHAARELPLEIHLTQFHFFFCSLTPCEAVGEPPHKQIKRAHSRVWVDEDVSKCPLRELAHSGLLNGWEPIYGARPISNSVVCLWQKYYNINSNRRTWVMGVRLKTLKTHHSEPTYKSQTPCQTHTICCFSFSFFR